MEVSNKDIQRIRTMSYFVEATHKVIEEEGFEVVCVYDGDEAIAKVYEQNFDLLLLDVNVPNKSGFDVLKETRS